MIPDPPSGWARSGWVANQLIPDANTHSSALQYLGGIGNPASNPSASGIPRVSGQTLSAAPNSLYSPQQQPTWQMPAWLNQLLFGAGVPAQPAVAKPMQTTALQQTSSPTPVSAQFKTPQAGTFAPPKPKSRGLFGTILDLSPGSPTALSKDSIFGIGF